MVVFAVDEEDSLEQAERILYYLKTNGVLQKNAVILVANKTDLVRSRVVKSSCKYTFDYISTVKKRSNAYSYYRKLSILNYMLLVPQVEQYSFSC